MATKEPKRERESSEESSEDDQDDEVLVEDDDLHPLDRPIKREALPSPPRSAFYCEPVSEADAANLARECAEVGRGLPAGALRGAGLFSACDHPSVTTAEGLIVLANWPPRPI